MLNQLLKEVYRFQDMNNVRRRQDSNYSRYKYLLNQCGAEIVYLSNAESVKFPNLATIAEHESPDWTT
jgi:hypothetical protein